jgi:small subunit ribosomal protein S8
MFTDPIADMLTRIRNAITVKRPHVDVPASKLKRGLAEVLKREGYIWDWQEERAEGEPVANLRLELKYGANGEVVIQHIKRVSTPGRRVYRKAKELRPVLHGMGITILSTSSGIYSDREARQKNIGGEVLCEIY